MCSSSQLKHIIDSEVKFLAYIVTLQAKIAFLEKLFLEFLIEKSIYLNEFLLVKKDDFLE